MKRIARLASVALWLVCFANVAVGSSQEPTEHIIEITGFKFEPAILHVNVGDTITWVNKDIAPHTATANDGSFDTAELKQNESVSIVVINDKPVSYFCQYHPSMKAKIILE